MKVVSLFAGCGGLDLGFEKAGFNIIWANENDKTIHQTYKKNHPKTQLNTQDIRTITVDKIPDCDGIIGGPPCQSWSEGGKRKGIEDPRGKLFLDYIRIVKGKQPKFFVIENVRGILDRKHSDSLNDFLTQLQEAGYNVKYKLLNALDYRIPQDRYRVFFVGIRKDLVKNYIFPKSTSDTIINLQQSIGDLANIKFNSSNSNILSTPSIIANHDVYYGPFDEKYMSRNRLRLWHQPSFTIQAQAKNIPLHPSSPPMLYVSPTKRIFVHRQEHLYRRLSVRECARIQSFPDSFIFHYSDIKDGYKMVGNAVPPRLAFELAKEMKSCFVEYFENKINLIPQKETNIKSYSVAFLAKHYKHSYLNPHIIISRPTKNYGIDTSLQTLVCLVKDNYANGFINKSAAIYYTGTKIPSIIKFKSIHYLIPYIKGKGIKDIYYVKSIRISSKKEIEHTASDDDFRVFFDIVFIKSLYNEFRPLHLNIWNTFIYAPLEQITNLK